MNDFFKELTNEFSLFYVFMDHLYMVVSIPRILKTFQAEGEEAWLWILCFIMNLALKERKPQTCCEGHPAHFHSQLCSQLCKHFTHQALWNHEELEETDQISRHLSKLLKPRTGCWSCCHNCAENHH